MKQVTKRMQEKALEVVATEVARKLGRTEPLPTGQEAAYSSRGPMLLPVETYGMPAVYMEGGPLYDWPLEIDWAQAFKLAGLPVWGECQNVTVLGLFRTDQDD